MTRALAVVAASLVLSACGAAVPPPARVKVKLSGTPPDAIVTVDDQVVGPLRVAQKFGLALPPGRHRITVARDGYYPWDRIVEATSAPLALDVALEKLPE